MNILKSGTQYVAGFRCYFYGRECRDPVQESLFGTPPTLRDESLGKKKDPSTLESLIVRGIESLGIPSMDIPRDSLLFPRDP